MELRGPSCSEGKLGPRWGAVGGPFSWVVREVEGRVELDQGDEEENLGAQG